MIKHFEVYLFNEIPPTIRDAFELGTKDKGIDILYKDNDVWVPVQCKWKKKTNLSIDKNQILGFIEEAKKFTTKALVTNVRKKSKYICNRYNINWILRRDFEKIVNRDFIQFIVDKLAFDQNPDMDHQHHQHHQHQNIVLRDCQKEALSALSESDSDRKQCIMFCGTGKSKVMIEYIKMKNVNKVLVLMPSLQLITQFYNNIKHHTKTKILCICSKFDKESLTDDINDTNEDDDKLLTEYLTSEENNISYTTEPNIIARELKKNKMIVLCTYQSSRLLKNHKFDLGLFDEAHVTVNNNTFGFVLDDDNCHINERVFFTATPRYYKGNDEKCISMNNVSVYGEEVFNYPYTKAKDDRYVLDFQIVTYAVPENMNDLIDEQFITQDDVDVKKEILISAIMLAQHITKTEDCQKILTYHNTIANAIEYKKTLSDVFLKYNINAKIFTLCGNTSMTKRKEIFNEYETSGIAIICSSRVLNAGIDLPCTDTIAFVDPRSSTIDVTQCVGRGLRLYKEQQVCKVIIPIHYRQLENAYNYDDLIKILIAMNEIDNKLIENFVNKNTHNKIKVIQMSLDEIRESKSETQAKYNFEDVMKGLTISIISSQTLGHDYKVYLLFKYCDAYQRAPQHNTRYEDTNIGMFLKNQKKRIQTVDDELYKKLSQNKYVQKNLDEYLLTVENNKTKEKLEWEQWRQMLFEYCRENKCSPPQRVTFRNMRLGGWLHNQKGNIRSTEDALYVKLSENEYVKESLDWHLMNLDNHKDRDRLSWEQWKQLLFDFCTQNECVPKSNTVYQTKSLGTWYNDQKKKVKTVDSEVYKKLAENEYIKDNLNEFLNPGNGWRKLLFKYCDENEHAPHNNTVYENKNLGCWYQNKKRSIKSVNDELYKKLSENKYVKESLNEFLNPGTNSVKWNETKQLLFAYCDENKCTPPQYTIYQGVNIDNWFQGQKKRIKSINDELYKKLAENTYVKESIDNRLNPHAKMEKWKQLLFQYCNENKWTPSQTTIFQGMKLGYWYQDQKCKIKSIDDDLYKSLSENEYVKDSLDRYLENAKQRSSIIKDIDTDSSNSSSDHDEDVKVIRRTNIKKPKPPPVKQTIVRIRKVVPN